MRAVISQAAGVRIQYHVGSRSTCERCSESSTCMTRHGARSDASRLVVRHSTRYATPGCTPPTGMSKRSAGLWAEHLAAAQPSTRARSRPPRKRPARRGGPPARRATCGTRRPHRPPPRAGSTGALPALERRQRDRDAARAQQLDHFLLVEPGARACAAQGCADAVVRSGACDQCQRARARRLPPRGLAPLRAAPSGAASS